MLMSRRGLTLAEMLVALALLGLVLATLGAISVREQRVFADLGEEIALTDQLREAAAVIPLDLRGASVPGGDFSVAEMRDTSLQLRSTIAAAVVCDTTWTGVILAPEANTAATFAGTLVSPVAGDTAWLLSVADTTERWLPLQISSVGGASAGTCAPTGPRLVDSATVSVRVVLRFASPPQPLAATIGVPVRVTRPVRYSLYRASDSKWYVGERDWSAATAKFNTIQPVAGPFLSAASAGLVFRYLDSTGVALPTPVSDAGRVAAIQLQVRGQTRDVARTLHSGIAAVRRGDSAEFVVALRNRK